MWTSRKKCLTLTPAQFTLSKPNHLPPVTPVGGIVRNSILLFLSLVGCEVKWDIYDHLDYECRGANDTWATDCDLGVDSLDTTDDTGETGNHTGDTNVSDDADGDGWTVESGDCDDNNAGAYPGNTEVWYDGVDGDCNHRSDYDQDGDGYDSDAYGGTDCNDLAALQSPGLQEIDGDSTDNDCDGLVDEDLTTDDLDMDGWTEIEGDCNDLESAVNPEAVDLWYDGVDQNCDGLNDYDQDGDGWESSDYGGDDCNDLELAVNPGMTELCDGSGVDEDCNGLVNDDDPGMDPSGRSALYHDADGDLYGDPATESWYCASPDASWIGDSTDCNDLDATVHPGATESCNGTDDDCDGTDDESGATGESVWYRDIDGDGYGDVTQTTMACTQPATYVSDATDCEDGESSVNPSATETCDGRDEDCDGIEDNGCAVDTGDTGVDTGVVVDSGDTGVGETGFVDTGDSTDTAVTIDTGDTGVDTATETAGDTGLVDTDTGATAVDDDGDGWTDLGGDCDDSDAAINPDAVESLYDNVDVDCDGYSRDDGTSFTISLGTVEVGSSLTFDSGSLLSQANGDFSDGSTDDWTFYVDPACTAVSGVTASDFALVVTSFADTLGDSEAAIVFPDSNGCDPYMVCAFTPEFSTTVGDNYGSATLVRNDGARRYGFRVYLGSEWDADPVTADYVLSKGIDAAVDEDIVTFVMAALVSDRLGFCAGGDPATALTLPYVSDVTVTP